MDDLGLPPFEQNPHVVHVTCFFNCVNHSNYRHYRDPTMSRRSHSFCFPPLWTHFQEVMLESCLLVFTHSERKRQKSSFPNRNLSFLLFLFLLALAMQGFFFAHFLTQTGSPAWGSCSFERVAFLGRMSLLLSPGGSWFALRLCSGCSGTTLTFGCSSIMFDIS